MYTTDVKINERYEVVFNLEEVYPGLYLPLAFIVTLDKGGLLAHIKQRAMSGTVASFDLELTTVRKELFEIIEELQIKSLEKKFSPPRRKIKPLEVLLEDEVVRKSIFVFVHRKLDVLLGQVVKHNFPITWNVERKVLVKDFLMKSKRAPLEARLSFKRTEEEVQYQLRLADEEGPWKISEKEVIPITNHPAWLFVDDQLVKVEHINGNMVKPFRQRDIVRIPKDKVKTYFQKFIVKIASRLDIDAEGFDVVQHDGLQACQIEIMRSLFSDELVLSLKMEYPHSVFTWGDPKALRTTLEFENDDIRIIQVRRDHEGEAVFIEKIKAFGLDNVHGAYFKFPEENDNDFHLVEWLIQNQLALEKAGFKIGGLELETQEIYLKPAELNLESEKTNDWFDIHGSVKIGEFSFPFLKLAPYIADENRFYPLPNGQIFLIPMEWMNKYRALIQFANRKKGSLRINKNQFTLLKEVGIAEQHEVNTDLDNFQFTPSSKLNATLRPYQLAGAKWLVQLFENELGACLADDMGLGKTLQTITVLLHAKEQRQNQKSETKKEPSEAPQLDLFSAASDEEFLNPLNALIVLPASLVFNWADEIARFAPHLSVYRHTGPKRHKKPELIRRFDVILTTYQTALRDTELLKDLVFEYIVLDESQQIKNRESKVFKALNTFQAKHKVSLSGTPIENSLSDLWSQMQFINPNLLGGYSFFKREFITPIEKHQDEPKKKQLRSLVKPYLLRRTKEEVASDLPPLSTKIFYSEMTTEQKKLYEKEKSAARNYLLENFDSGDPKYRILILQSLTKLRQIANHPRLVYPDLNVGSGKFKDILEHWDVIRRSDHKALFFSSFVQYLNLFKTQFQEEGQLFSWLTGDLSAKDREKAIRNFETDRSVQSFLISIKSGGTGLNLTAADYVFILDPWWNPTTEQQAIARAHRIGQEKSVMAVKFITRDTIEEKILKLQLRKSKLAGDILGNINKRSFSSGDLEYLLD